MEKELDLEETRLQLECMWDKNVRRTMLMCVCTMMCEFLVNLLQKI